MSLVALFESFKEKKQTNQKEKKNHKMVNTYVSSFSLAASQFPRCVSSKGLHTWWKATAQNELLVHWCLPTYFFIYLFILPCLFQESPWFPLSVWDCSDPFVEEKGWDDPHGVGAEEGLQWPPLWVCGCRVWQVHKSAAIWCTLEAEKMWRHVTVLVKLP